MSNKIKELNNDILHITKSVIVHTPKYSKYGGYDGENSIYTMDIAKELYQKGWRKQSEVEKIFEQIDTLIVEYLDGLYSTAEFIEIFNKLKKKYTEGEE